MAGRHCLRVTTCLLFGYFLVSGASRLVRRERASGLVGDRGLGAGACVCQCAESVWVCYKVWAGPGPVWAFFVGFFFFLNLRVFIQE